MDVFTAESLRSGQQLNAVSVRLIYCLCTEHIAQLLLSDFLWDDTSVILLPSSSGLCVISWLWAQYVRYNLYSGLVKTPFLC
jgi:hypothetical protein